MLRRSTRLLKASRRVKLPDIGCSYPTRNLTTIGIRKEDPARIWERRTPLTPEAVSELISLGKGKGKDEVKVEVESCGRRCFTDIDYQHAGATILPSLSPKVDLVLGIKEPPVQSVHELLKADPKQKRTWMMFSHTHKGQTYNTPLLSSFLNPQLRQTLIDYELLAAPSGSEGRLKRVAAFGWYAGAVGAGEALCMTGMALLRKGIATPLLGLPRPYTFPSIDQYRAALRHAGDQIRSTPITPSEDAHSGPLVIGLTGAGNVSQGAKEMLDSLCVEWVDVARLPTLGETNKVYACQIPPSSYLVRDGKLYDREDYYSNPTAYRSTFSDKVAPYLTCLINGAGWQEGFPRTISSAQMQDLIHTEGTNMKLVAVQDIACDMKGGLEFIDQHTTIDDPFFVGPGGSLISSIDILPTELAADASTYFCSRILHYVKHIIDPTSSNPPSRQNDDTLKRATIVKDGNIQKAHEWLLPRVTEYRSSSIDSVEGAQSNDIKRKKKILLLGSGLVAGPAVDVFSARTDIQLAIGSNNLSEATALIKNRSNVEALALDISDASALEAAVQNSDVVVSLLPAPMHVAVAKHCIEQSKHLITASYISPEMKSLSDQAIVKDVLILGECGLDPGIDSMAAMRILSRVKNEKKRVQSFISWCGGLPEPGASNVPFRYKFSWSPKAVLTAAGNEARFKLDGKIATIPGGQLLTKCFPKVDLWKGLPLEGLANRDSLPYADKYGLGHVDGLTNLFRGTLRYQGFSRLLESFRKIGLLGSEPFKSETETTTSSDFLLAALARTAGVSKLQQRDLPIVLKDVLGVEWHEAFEALDWLGMVSPSRQLSIPSNLRSPIDILAYVLSIKLAYGPNERDSCLLHHSFTLRSDSSCSQPENSPNIEKLQTVTASLLHYDTPEASSMSMTVGKTLAFAALRVADGHVKERGVTGPYEREVWEGVLDNLEDAGVRVVEDWGKAIR